MRSSTVLRVITVAAVLILTAGCTRPQWEPKRPVAPQRGPVVPTSDYRLTGPYSHDNLTVFIVCGPETLDTPLLTLPEALEQQKVVVREAGFASELFAENLTAGEEVVLHAGDILRGGKCDRAVHSTMVIGPNSGRVSVMTWSVDESRYGPRESEPVTHFPAAPFILPTAGLRRVAYSSQRTEDATDLQPLLNAAIANAEDALGVRNVDPATNDPRPHGCGASLPRLSSLALALPASPVRTGVDPYIFALDTVLDGHPDAIGYVAVVNGRVATADVYASRALFRAVWPRLLDGAAVEAVIATQAGGYPEPPTVVDVLAVLADVEAGRRHDWVPDRGVFAEERRTSEMMMFDYGDPARGNLVLHRSFVTR